MDERERGHQAVLVELRLELLGECSVRLGQRPVPEAAFPRRKALSLLKLLALQPGYQIHRDRALEILWPDLSPDAAGSQLYKAVHHIRQALASADPPAPPDALLQLRGDTLSLAAPGGVATDVAEFEALARQALRSREIDMLQRAVGRYTGDLLPADLYEPWAIERRDTLREQFIDLLADLGEGLLTTGALAEAADALRQAIACDPTREAAHRGLMLVYARQGSRARALRQYRVCALTMERELGVDVSSGTAALYQEILADRVPRVEPTATGPALNLTLLPPLIGRQAELRAISVCLDQLARGHSSVLGLEGAAGIGKTRLAQEILRLGRRRHWHVLYGSAHEAEGQLPYLPFVEALRAALWTDPAGAELIPAELAVAMPEITASATIAIADPPAAQQALFAGVARFLAARARTASVILILDDLHAMDAGSLKLFHYLAREAAALPLCLVGIWRPDEPGASPAPAEMIGSLERRHILRRLPLAALSVDEHHALLAQELGGGHLDPRLATELYRFSEGNALFTREMARQLAADGGIVEAEGTWRFASGVGQAGAPSAPSIPRSLRALTKSRLASLSPAAAQLLQLAAIIGRDIPLPILERGLQAGEAGAALLDLLDEVLAAGLLAESGLTLRFPHPLLREAVYEQMVCARRSTLHGTVADVLEGLSTEAPGTVSVEAIAFHYRHAGNIGRAVHYLLLAGARAEAVYDHEGALGRYGEALALLQGDSIDRAPLPAEVQERIGDTYRAIGDVTRSLAAYRLALEAKVGEETAADHRRRFALHRKTSVNAILTLDMPAAAEHLALARANLGTDPLDEARILIAEALLAWHTHRFDTALQQAGQALAIAERLGARVEESQAYEMMALAHLPLGHWEEGLRCESRRHTPVWSPDIVVAIDAHLCLFQYTLHSAESLQDARSFIEAVVRQAELVGNQRCVAVCHFVLGSLAVLQGLPHLAAESLARALELHERVGSPAGVAYTLARQVELLAAAGIHAPVPRLVERGIEAAERASVRGHCATQVYTAGIRSRLAAGDDTGAATLVEAARAHDATCPPCPVCRVDLYEALAACSIEFGELELAQSHIDPALSLADLARNHPGRARLIRARGRIHAARGETAEAERCLLEAAGTFRRVGDQYDLARTFQTLAALAGRQDRAELLRQAEATLAAYRAVPLAAITGT
jgi:DNA-binding SARP family transcriptional activator